MRRHTLALLCAVACFLTAGVAHAANKILYVEETQRLWSDLAHASEDEELDLGDGACGADCVRLGSYWDRGAGSLAGDFRWCIRLAGYATAPEVGADSIDLYFSVSQTSSDFAGPEAPADTTDAAGAENRLRNLIYAGSAISHSTTDADDVEACGYIFLPWRYIAPVVHVNGDDAASTGDGDHEIVLIPIPPEVQ